MRLDELPDLALHQILLRLEARDITSLQQISHKFFHYIQANRHYYGKFPICEIRITLEKNGKRLVKVQRRNLNLRMVMNTLIGATDVVMKSLNPDVLISYDHDELANMHHAWWRDRKEIELNNVVDIRRYLPHFDRCTTIFLKSDNPMNISEVLASMEAKNLVVFSVSGTGPFECTSDDLLKIGRLSKNMRYLHLGNFSDSSNISSDDILDMIEIGSFAKSACLEFPKIQTNMLNCLGRRDWVVKSHRLNNTCFVTETSGGVYIRIEEAKKQDTDAVRTMLRRSRGTRSWLWRPGMAWDFNQVVGVI